MVLSRIFGHILVRLYSLGSGTEHSGTKKVKIAAIAIFHTSIAWIHTWVEERDPGAAPVVVDSSRGW